MRNETLNTKNKLRNLTNNFQPPTILSSIFARGCTPPLALATYINLEDFHEVTVLCRLRQEMDSPIYLLQWRHFFFTNLPQNVWNLETQMNEIKKTCLIMMFNINPPHPKKKTDTAVFPPPKIITTNVQGSKIKAKSIEMAPVIGKVLVESTRGTSWVDGCWEQKTCQKPMRMIRFPNQSSSQWKATTTCRVFFGRHATSKNKHLFYLLDSTQSQIFLDFCWIKTSPKINYIQNLPQTQVIDSYILFLTSTVLPCPPQKTKTLDDVFKPLSHRGWTIWPSSIRYYNSAKTTTPSGGEAEVHRHQQLFWSQFCSIWLVSLVVETILGIFPSSCLYGGGYHWLISLAFPHSNISQQKTSPLQFSNRSKYQKVTGSLVVPYISRVFQAHVCFSVQNVTDSAGFFRNKKRALPLSWCNEKKRSQHVHFTVCRGPYITNSNTAFFMTGKSLNITSNICIKFDSPPKKKWLLQWPPSYHHGNLTAIYAMLFLFPSSPCGFFRPIFHTKAPSTSPPPNLAKSWSLLVARKADPLGLCKTTCAMAQRWALNNLKGEKFGSCGGLGGRFFFQSWKFIWDFFLGFVVTVEIGKKKKQLQCPKLNFENLRSKRMKVRMYEFRIWGWWDGIRLWRLVACTLHRGDSATDSMFNEILKKHWNQTIPSIKTHPFGYLHLYCVLEISCIHIQLMTLHLAKDCRWRSHNSPRPWPWWLQLFFSFESTFPIISNMSSQNFRELGNSLTAPNKGGHLFIVGGVFSHLRAYQSRRYGGDRACKFACNKHLKKLENYERGKMSYSFYWWHNLTSVLDSYFSGLLLLRSVQQYQTAKTHGGQLHQNPEPIFTCPVSHVTNPRFAKKNIESLEGGL